MKNLSPMMKNRWNALFNKYIEVVGNSRKARELATKEFNQKYGGSK